MIDEFLQSLDGLRDELTGLLSKEIFRSRYALTLGRGTVDTKVIAVLFGVSVDHITAMVGSQTALEVLKTLGAYVNKYFASLGGFSARHSRDRILTILPHTGLEEAGQLVRDIALELQQKALPEMNSIIAARARGGCLEISVTAGITGGSVSDDIENIMKRAEDNNTIIAHYKCSGEEGSQ
jgi:phospholipid/cholesterol/gamma-HCH transport system ATP-binding protein